jgi:hypothetical protein
MKRLFFALILVAGSAAIATSADAQVYIGAHFGVRLPIHHRYYGPQVIYNAPVPAPYYDNGVLINSPEPYYDNGLVVGANLYNRYPVYNGYPVYGHNYGRGYYRGARGRHYRR